MKEGTPSCYSPANQYQTFVTAPLGKVELVKPNGIAYNIVSIESVPLYFYAVFLTEEKKSVPCYA